MKDLPLAYRERMQALLGEDFAAYEAALQEEPVAVEETRATPKTNTVKVDRQQLAAVYRRKNVGYKYVAASLLGGLLLSGAVAALRIATRHA